MEYTDRFSAQMGMVYNLVDGHCGCDEIRNSLFGWFDGDIDTNAKGEWLETYRYSNNGMFYLLYDLVNYDLVSITKKSINVRNSNVPEIAKIIKEYATDEMISKVYNNIFG